MTGFVSERTTWRTVLRLARRDLRGGLGGFYVFLACLALGVASIAGVGSLARGLSEGLEREGTVILGGDASFSLIHQQASVEQRRLLEQHGKVSEVATLRAMARAPGEESTLVEMRAVDSAYPLVGSVLLEPAIALPDILSEREGAFGAAADALLFSRLNLKIGDRIQVGAATLELRAKLLREPDGLSRGTSFGTRMLVGTPALAATGLVQPGSLVRWSYRVLLPDRGPGALERLEADTKGWAEAGFEIRSRTRAAPQLERQMERFTQFLTIVGLTALVVGGVGVANAVSAYIDRKREVIATLKCLGASGGTVFAIFLLEVMALATLGTAVGLAVGALLPFALSSAFAAVLPLPISPAVYPRELLLATAYGFLTVLAFSLWPLARAREVPVALLYRENIAPVRRWPRLPYVLATAVAAAALVALAVFAAYDRRIALIFVGAMFAAFVSLRLVALVIMRVARALPRQANTELRLALANLHRPGALTPSVVLSLGLGLALLVALTLTDAAVRSQLSASLPDNAPSLFLLDVPASDGARLDGLVSAAAPGAEVERVPMLRGSIVRLKGVPAAEAKVGADAKFALTGDRGITFATTLPDDSRIVAGEWWKADHTGSNLVSFEDKLAAGLGLSVGDEITVNVLGRTVTATVANLRRVEWRKLGINFFMVFSPNTFAGAPHMDLATVTFPKGSMPADEEPVLRGLTKEFPSVAVVRVRDALADIGALFANLALGIRAASGVTVLASILVLGGALAAGHRQRIYDAVVLKTLGATRARLLLAYTAEYGLIGMVTALFGLLAGAIAAFWITTSVMDIPFVFDLAAPIAALAALVLTVGLGLIGTFRLLGEPPARHLRTL